MAGDNLDGSPCYAEGDRWALRALASLDAKDNDVEEIHVEDTQSPPRSNGESYGSRKRTRHSNKNPAKQEPRHLAGFVRN